ncbi:MAG: hypothetical protein JWN48_886 [Myxococcaceae bacterium]|nr:hypothetical protein [Myxococcaceae bacterium]
MTLAQHMQPSGVVDIGWYRDRIGNVEVSFVHGMMTELSFDHFLADTCRAIDERAEDEQVAMMTEVWSPALQDGRRRKRMADAFRERTDKLARTRPAFAMVTPSLIVRSAMTVVLLTAQPPYPYTVVRSVHEAFAFIARHLPGLDAASACAEYERRRSLILATLGAGERER